MAKETQRQLKRMYKNLEKYAVALNDAKDTSFHKSIKTTNKTEKRNRLDKR